MLTGMVVSCLKTSDSKFVVRHNATVRPCTWAYISELYDLAYDRDPLTLTSVLRGTIIG